MLFPLTEGMDNRCLITGLRPVYLSTSVFSAFRTIGLTDLQVTHEDMFALGCMKPVERGPHIFPVFGAGMRGPISEQCSVR